MGGQVHGWVGALLEAACSSSWGQLLLLLLLLLAPLPHHPGVPTLPLLPPAADFIETRRAALTIFLNRVVGGSAGWFVCRSSAAQFCSSKGGSGLYLGSLLFLYTHAPALLLRLPACLLPAALQAAHPALRSSPDLQLFLEASETEFGIEVSRSQVEDPGVGQVGSCGLRCWAVARRWAGRGGYLGSWLCHWQLLPLFFLCCGAVLWCKTHTLSCPCPAALPWHRALPRRR